MKTIFSLFVLLTVIIGSSRAQSFLGYYDYATFFAPGTGPYLETYIAAYTPSLAIVEKGGQFEAGVEVTVIIKEEDKLVNFDKFDLLSGPIEDTAAIDFNLLGQRRMALDNGTYSLEVTLKDLNAPDHVVVYPAKTVLVDFPVGEIAVSGIELIEKFGEAGEENPFNKNGLKLTPYPLGFYPTFLDEMLFYLEVYNLNKSHAGQEVAVFYSIRTNDTTIPLNNFQGFQKIKVDKVNPVIGRLNIKDLTSGNYELVVEVRDRENELLVAAQSFFQRSNKKAVSNLDNIKTLNVEETFAEGIDTSELEFYLSAMKLIASEVEERIIDVLISQKDEETQRKFLYNFWLERDLVNTEKTWRKYKSMVNFTEKQYATINRHGYATDRGRVYLQYGPPNDIFRSPFEPGTRPYELWHYNIINSETDIRFVFYNEDMISNDYRLIHSNKRGELRDDQWKLIVTGEKSPDLDRTEPGRDMGSGVPEPFRK